MTGEMTTQMIFWLIGFVAIVGFLLLDSFRQRIPSVGLPLAYTFNLLMNHYFGALIYVLPWWGTEDARYVYLGFQQTFYGIAAFAFGSAVLGPAFIRNFVSCKKKIPVEPPQKLPTRYLQIGLIFYFVLAGFFSRIPSFATFVQSSWFLLIAAICLSLWDAWQKKKWKTFVIWMAVSLIFPFSTVVRTGFMYQGVVAVMIIIFFTASFFKPRWVALITILLGMYLGLSLCMTYLRDRNELREAIWYGNEAVTERSDRVLETLLKFEFLDLGNQDHLYRIDSRLNQNFFVGKSVARLQAGDEPFSEGWTLWEAVIALVPRIFWPEKPVYGGSPGLVARYAGIEVNEQTSFGVGQVMEFYINFGTPCVISGFLILGVLLRFFDFKAAQYLMAGDWKHFTFWFLPGLGFIQSGGSLVEVVGSVAAAAVFCVLINIFLLHDFTIRILHKKK